MSVLTVWLRGSPVAELRQLRTGRLRLQFDDAVVSRYGSGAALPPGSTDLGCVHHHGDKHCRIRFGAPARRTRHCPRS